MRIWFHIVLIVGFSVQFRLTRLCVCLQPGSGHWASVRIFEKRKVNQTAILWKEKNMWEQTCGLNLLVKEIFVHNGWNIQQGISHPKECVFTVKRHTRPLCYSFKLCGRNLQFVLEVMFLAGWTEIHKSLIRPKAVFTTTNAAGNCAIVAVN